MSRDLQAMVLLLLGMLTLRISVTDMFLNYVREPMRPLLIISGVLLIALAFLALLRPIKDAQTLTSGTTDGSATTAGGDHDHDHSRAPLTAWLLLIPVITIFLIAPPPLGSAAAQNDKGVVTNPNPDADTDSGEALFPPLGSADPAVLGVDEYSARALYDEGRTLVDRRVTLTGFVTPGPDGRWYLTRFAASCCAADATAVKVLVTDWQAPPEEEWVEVTGTYTPQPGTDKIDLDQPPAIRAENVTPIQAPRDTYL